MRNFHYAGWFTDATPTVVWIGEDVSFDLRDLCAEDGITKTFDYEWGCLSQGAIFLASSIIWHATRDMDKVIRLTGMFCSDVVSRFGGSWSIDRESVRSWCDIVTKRGADGPTYPWAWIHPSRN